MLPEKSEALVIRHVDFSETSKIVTLFSRDFGKISALAKGARRLKGPFEAALDLLSRCRIVFLRKSSGGLDLLTEAQLVSRFRPSGKNMAAVYAGWYVAELLDGLTEPHDPHPVLYQEAVAALERFADDSTLDRSLLRFELSTLREIGQLPAFDGCLVCGATTDANLTFSYWVSQSGLICRNCRHDEFTHLTLTPGSLAILKRLAAEEDAGVDRLVLSPQQQKEIRRVVTAAVTHCLGHPPKMMGYLKGQ